MEHPVTPDTAPGLSLVIAVLNEAENVAAVTVDIFDSRATNSARVSR